MADALSVDNESSVFADSDLDKSDNSRSEADMHVDELPRMITDGVLYVLQKEDKGQSQPSFSDSDDDSSTCVRKCSERVRAYEREKERLQPRA